MTDTRRRVKIYMLNEDRQWDDRGTGHVTSTYVDRLKGMSLLVRSETDGNLLLESKIQTDIAYQKQLDTLVIWTEADKCDLALSFQEKAGCDEIWEKICQVQGKDPSVEVTQDVIEESEGERFDDVSDNVGAPIELPAAELGRLQEICEVFQSAMQVAMSRDKLAMEIENEGYIKQLTRLFHMCEDLQDTDGLHQLYDIFRNIFLLNKNGLFETLFSDDVVFDTVGILEYDPSAAQYPQHRHYLRNVAKFKEVIPFANSDLVQRIHQTYRAQYIQDVILPTPSVFEENMLSALSSFIFFNKIEIVSMIQEDERLLTDIFTQLKEEETDDAKRKDLMLFLKELCTFSQTLQPQNREPFFKTLANLGIYSTLEIVLSMDSQNIKSAAVDVFSYLVEFSPSMIREFVLVEGSKQDDEDLLINLVIEQMIGDADPELGGALQLSGMLRILVDPDNMLATANKTEKTEFLGFFYKHSMHVLTAPLFANTSEGRPSNDDYQTAQLLYLIIELLTFCIEHHTYHMKNYVLNKDLLQRALVLLQSRHAFLVLGALRMMRKVIGLKDEFYNRYIIKGNLFAPVFDAFHRNGDRYNLLNSAMIELFEFIRQEDIRSLIIYLVETHVKQVEHVQYVRTFRELRARYDQHQEARRQDGSRTTLESVGSMLSGRTNASRFRRDARTLEEEEEMWFDQEDEMEEAETMVDPINSLPLRGTKMDPSDVLKDKSKLTHDHFNNLLDNRKGGVVKDSDWQRESPPRVFQHQSISIQLGPNALKTPPTSPITPTTSPTIIAQAFSPGALDKFSPGSPGSLARPPSPPIGPSAPPVSPQQQNHVTDVADSVVPPQRAESSPLFSAGMVSDQAAAAAKKIGLVDYPDEDSDDDDEEEQTVSSSSAPSDVIADSAIDSQPATKRARVNS